MSEAGNNSNDFLTFEASLSLLRRSLTRDYVEDSNSFIISLSRKGPLIIDIAYENYDMPKFNIMTEFALPMLFRSLQFGEKYRFYLVDDAIYFGSTMRNLYIEILEYAKVYGIEITLIRAYVAIIDKNAMDLAPLIVEGKRNVRDGYGHYFVKELMHRFRLHHKCLEIEYPSFDFTLAAPLDCKKFINASKNHGVASVYENEYDEDNTLSVIFQNGDSQFSKFRLYPNGTHVIVAAMAPRVLVNDREYIHREIGRCGIQFDKLWQKIEANTIDDSIDNELKDFVRRNKIRNLIVLANYILSFNDFLSYSEFLSDCFAGSGYLDTKFTINTKSLFYLTGNEKLVNDIISFFYSELEQPKVRIFAGHRDTTDENIIFEQADFPPLEDRKFLDTHNLHMVRNSLSIQQALSALFFNQNIFVDKNTRKREMAKDRKLWFGYTYDSLENLIAKYGRFGKPEDLGTNVHQWVDGRIDRGCVVPQYILDSQKDCWKRVFRPGENEDLVLSHLARFVISIFTNMVNANGYGYVNERFLNNMLAVVHKRLWDDSLAKQFYFEIKREYNRLTLTGNEIGKDVDVLTLLRKMYIIDIEDEEVSISPRIIDDELLCYTTLDADTQTKIDNLVGEVMIAFKKSQVPMENSQNVFNFYLNEDMTTEELCDAYNRAKNDLMLVIENIKIHINAGLTDFMKKEKQDLLFDCFDEVMKYDVNTIFYSKDKTIDVFRAEVKENSKVGVWRRFNNLLFIMNMIASVYLIHDVGKFTSFYENDYMKNFMTMNGWTNIEKIVSQIINEGSFCSVHKSLQLTNALTKILQTN